jgi:tRNA-2-methylthio-N6-dimethylallyladenosine synthase
MENVLDGYQIVAVDPIHQMEDAHLPKRSSDVAAYVNVIYGCNERCTYCVVPHTRGVEQSRTKEAIVGEIEALVASGYKEVTLLGQNVDSWGRDFSPKQRFSSLLTAVAKIPGLKRVRFLTSHPKYISERVILAVKENSNLMPCFYFPFQHGDNLVLQNMRRGYTRERYLDIVKKIRFHIPDAAIIADCIVGFPGETEEQFENSLDLMRAVKFEQVMTAAYSPRPNTPAADWQDQTSQDVKTRRLETINRLAAEHALERSERFVGRAMPVLVEDVNVRRPTQLVGRNEHSRLVYFEGNYRKLKGKIVKIKITEARAYSLTGEIVCESKTRQ